MYNYIRLHTIYIFQTPQLESSVLSYDIPAPHQQYRFL